MLRWVTREGRGRRLSLAVHLDRPPCKPEEGVGLLPHCPQVLAGNPTSENRLHRERRGAALIGRVKPSAIAVAQHPDTQPRTAAHRAERNAFEAGREAAACVAACVQSQDVKRGVQERRVHLEALCFGFLPLVERYLRVDLLAELPGSLQSLEGGAVFEAELGDGVIKALDLERLCPLGGPGVRLKAARGGRGAAEGAGGVAGEGSLLVVFVSLGARGGFGGPGAGGPLLPF